MEPVQDQRVYEFGNFRLDCGQGVLHRNGEVLALTPKMVDTLLALVERAGEVVNKEALMERVWPDTFVEENNLTYNISVLRKVLRGNNGDQSYIETLPRRGYRFVMEVRELPPPIQLAKKTGRELDESLGVTLSVPSEVESVFGPVPDTSPIGTAASESSPGERPRHARSMKGLLYLTIGLTFFAALGLYAWLNQASNYLGRSEANILPLTTLPGQENQPVLSPDGSRVAFCWNGRNEDNFDIYVRVVGTESQLRLTSSLAQETSPGWSPDGRFIAFERNTGSDTGFYVIPALGGPERKIADAFPTRSNFRGRRLDWFPDGKALAIVERDSDEEPFHICLLSMDTGVKRKLFSPVPPSTGVMGLAVSPDGKTVGFTAFLDGPDFARRHMDLYSISRDGGVPRRLSFADCGVVGLAWTPDSSQIIFPHFSCKGIAALELPLNLWRISPTGGQREVVPVPPTYAYVPNNPHIPRSGSKLVFEQRSLANMTDIWRAPGPLTSDAGTLPAKLIATTAGEEDPQFSPDGKKVVYTNTTSGTRELWVADPDGLNGTQLTSLGEAGAQFGRWSPDASRIAFHSAGDIWIAGSGGGPVRRLTSDSAAETLPSWSMDGRWVYFASERTGKRQVWRIPAAGGTAVQVTRNGGAEAIESFDGKYLYFTKYNGLPWTFATSSIWRMPVEGGEETLVIAKTSVGNWGLTREGVCYLNADGDLPFALEFLSFKNGTKRKFGQFDREPLWNSPSFSVSPDGEWILYTRRPSDERDLMLIENFR